MSPVRFVFMLSATLSALNGAIIIGNDVLIGIKTSLPMISSIVGILFLLIGFLVWQVGTHLVRLQSGLLPESMLAYKWLSFYLSAVVVTYGLFMFCVIYALCERISQGYSIFG